MRVSAQPRCDVVSLLPSRRLGQHSLPPTCVSLPNYRGSVCCPLRCRWNQRHGRPAQQTEEKATKSADTARLSEELFGLLSADAKPDDDVVVAKIEELEVCVCVCVCVCACVRPARHPFAHSLLFSCALIVSYALTYVLGLRAGGIRWSYFDSKALVGLPVTRASAVQGLARLSLAKYSTDEELSIR